MKPRAAMKRVPLLPVLAWRNLWRNPRRTLLVLAAIAIGVWSMIAFDALLDAWARSSLAATLRDLTGQAQLHAPGYLDDPGVDHVMPPPAGALRAALDGPAVARWAARVRVPAAIRSEFRTRPVTLDGIDPARERGLSFIAGAVREGRELAGPGDAGIVLGRGLAERLHTGVGRRVVVLSQSAAGGLAEQGFVVVGLFAAPPQDEDNEAFVGLATAQRMLGLGDAITGVALDLHDRAALPGFIAALAHAAPMLDARPWWTLKPLARALDQLSRSFSALWVAVMFALMAFGIVNTLLMALHERVRELALLQALGMRPGAIFGLVTLEAALVVALGVALGIALALATLLGLRGGLDLGFLAGGAEWLGAGRVLYPRLAWPQVAGVGALVWVLGVAAGLWPTWRLAWRVPIEAISHART